MTIVNDIWANILKESKKRYLLGFEIFKNHILLDVRENGLPRILKINIKNRTHEYIKFDEPCYDVSLAGNHNPKADYFCFAYSLNGTPSFLANACSLGVSSTLRSF